VKEADLSRKQIKALRERGAWAQKIPGTAYKGGLPDIIFTYKGRGGGVETKLPGKEDTLTELQASTLRDMRSAGALAFVASDVATVHKALDLIDRYNEL
jgi:hypothetical protein